MKVNRALLISLLCSPMLANAVTNYGLQSKIQFDILDDNTSTASTAKNKNTVLVNLKPYAYQENQLWRSYALLDLFAATDVVNYSETDSSSRNSDGYLGFRELWLDYTGFTSYPGEYLRTGLQRVRANDGLWWDTEIEALLWRFDTTLLIAEIAAAKRFSLYRSNDNTLPYSEEDRQHLLGSTRYQYQAGHWIEIRAHHTNNDKPLHIGSAEYSNFDNTLSNAQWLGIGLDSDYMNNKLTKSISYSINAIYMQAAYKVFDHSLIKEHTSGRFIETQVRYSTKNWHLGLAYADADACQPPQKCFFQTGMESNRSNFTGTRARIARFGESYRASLENLRVNTLYATWSPTAALDVEMIGHQFKSKNDTARVVNFINKDLMGASNNLGKELDMVASWYLKPSIAPMEWAVDDSAALRLRGGIFKPEDAYGQNKNDLVFHIISELTWSF